MTLVNTETGEIVGYDRAAAERRAERIRLRLDSIADNYATVMPMIREAIEKRDDLALGYRSVSEYVSDRFGGALTRLGVEVRREVVRELTEAGMSTRAIAPVVGTTHKTVVKDRQAISGGTSVPPAEPTVAVEPADLDGGYVASVDDMPGAMGQGETPEEAKADALDAAEQVKTVTGIDGKTYKRPEPKAKPKRKPLNDAALTAGWELRRAVERLQRIADDDRFSANKEAMAPHLRGHLTNAIEVCQDLLDRINN